MRVSDQTAIITWFVADDAASATWFPQVGGRSDAPEAQATYWRCTVAFFASSLALNPGARHMFYTNTRVPRIDGTDLAALFERWNVEVVTLQDHDVPPQLSINSVSVNEGDTGTTSAVFTVTLSPLTGRTDDVQAGQLDPFAVRAPGPPTPR